MSSSSFASNTFGTAAIASSPGSIENPISSDGLTITIQGLRVPGVINQSLSITRSLGQNGSAQFQFFDQGGFVASVGDEVVVSLFGVKVFAGLIENKTETYPGDLVSTGRFVDVAVVDFMKIATRRLITDEFEVQPADQVVSDVVSRLLEQEGISAGTIDAAVNVGPLVFQDVTAAEVLDRVAQIVKYDWWIDDEKLLHFVNRGTVPAPFDVTDQADTVIVSESREQYRNVQIVRGGKTLGTDRVEEFIGTGSQTSFDVGLPIGAAPLVRVDERPQTVGIRGVDDEGDPNGADWFWKKGDSSITQNRSREPLAAPDFEIGFDPVVLQVRFRPLQDAVAIARDVDEIAARAAQEGGSGVYEHVITESQVEAVGLASQLAESQLSRHSHVKKRVEVRTLTHGIQPGQLQTITLAKWGVSGDWLVNSVSIQDLGAGVFTTSYVASENVFDGGAAEFWKRLAQGQRSLGSSEESDGAAVGGLVDNIVVSDDVEGTSSGDTRGATADDVYTVALVGAGAKVGKRYEINGEFYSHGSKVGKVVP